MFADLLSIAVLASFVLVPMTLKIGGCRIESLFKSPSSRAMSCFYASVLILQGVAALAWLNMKLRFFGEPVMLWTLVLFLSYVWIRALMLVAARKPA